nr:unnamed protein product [Callosobruchus chinensis]
MDLINALEYNVLVSVHLIPGAIIAVNKRGGTLKTVKYQLQSTAPLDSELDREAKFYVCASKAFPVNFKFQPCTRTRSAGRTAASGRKKKNSFALKRNSSDCSVCSDSSSWSSSSKNSAKKLVKFVR